MMSKLFDLSGKVAIVTGSGRGHGPTPAHPHAPPRARNMAVSPPRTQLGKRAAVNTIPSL